MVPNFTSILITLSQLSLFSGDLKILSRSQLDVNKGQILTIFIYLTLEHHNTKNIHTNGPKLYSSLDISI